MLDKETKLTFLFASLFIAILLAVSGGCSPSPKPTLSPKEEKAYNEFIELTLDSITDESKTFANLRNELIAEKVIDIKAGKIFNKLNRKESLLPDDENFLCSYLVFKYFKIIVSSGRFRD